MSKTHLGLNRHQGKVVSRLNLSGGEFPSISDSLLYPHADSGAAFRHLAKLDPKKLLTFRNHALAGTPQLFGRAHVCAVSRTHCRGLPDARDQHPIPFGRAFRIHHRLCGRNHRATCREVGFGNTPTTDIHSLVAGSGACREPRLLRLLPVKLQRQKQEPPGTKR